MFDFIRKLFRRKPKKKLPNINKYKNIRKKAPDLPAPIEAPEVKRIH